VGRLESAWQNKCIPGRLGDSNPELLTQRGRRFAGHCAEERRKGEGVPSTASPLPRFRDRQARLRERVWPKTALAVASNRGRREPGHAICRFGCSRECPGVARSKDSPDESAG